MGRTLGNRRCIVTAHAHGEDGQSLIGCNFPEPAEVGGGRLVNRRNGHEAFDTEIVIASCQDQEVLDIRDQDARLLGFGPRIDLDQQCWRAPCLLDGIGKSTGQFRTVERLDDIEEEDRICGLVGLQWADQAEQELRQLDTARAPATLCLLDPVFAKHPLTRRQSRIDRGGLLGFRNRNESHLCRIASGCLRGGFDAGSNKGEARGYGRVG